MNRNASSPSFSEARRLSRSSAKIGKRMIKAVVSPPPNCSWLNWAGAVSILTGATVGLLGILQLVLNYFTFVAPGISLLSLFILWVVTTIYLPPPRSTRNE